MPRGKKNTEVAEAPKPVEAVITTRELSAELGLPGTELRKILRSQFYPDGVFTRYGWNPNDPVLSDIRLAVEEHLRGKVTAKAESETKKAERRTTRRASRAAAGQAAKEEPGEDVVVEDELEELEDLEDLDDDEEEE